LYSFFSFSHALTLAATVTIATASAEVTTPPMLLLMVDFVLSVAPCLLRRPPSEFFIPHPVALIPSIDNLFRSRQWLDVGSPAQQHTNHITKLKTFTVSTLLDFYFTYLE
jgi:hypothetical protein